MSLFSLRRRIMIEGIMPERALLKLQRAQIPVFKVKKRQKNQILLSVNGKDAEKVFAIYPKVCYNRRVHSSYVTHDLGAEGVLGLAEFMKKRAGFLLGAVAFVAITLFADTFVFGIKIVGAQEYSREVRQTLAEYGVTPFSRYEDKNTDLAIAKLLSLDGVEYCSVQKSGLQVVVEIRTSPFRSPRREKGAMLSKCTGTLLSLTVLQGTPLKKVGDKVCVGEPIVGGYFCTESGAYKEVCPVARASVACAYETEVSFEEVADEKEAFARALFLAGLEDTDCVTGVKTEKGEKAFHVKIEFVAIARINM